MGGWRKGLSLTALIIILITGSYIFLKRHTLLGVLYHTLRLEDKAIEEFRKSGDAYSLYHLGLIYKDKGDLDNAKEAYLKLLEIQPDHPHATYDLGYIYREKGEYEKALAMYDKALRINPDNIYAYYDRGYIYKKLGMYKKALSEYKEVLKRDPSHKYALWDISEVYELMGMHEKAEEQRKYYHEMTDCSLRRFWNCFD